MTKWFTLIVLLCATATYAAPPPVLPRDIVSTDRIPVVNTGTTNAYTVTPEQIAAHTVKAKFGNHSTLVKIGTGPNGPVFNGQPISQQGPSGTIAIGVTTTGNAGSNATVTNSGTNTNAVLNFTIPRGPQGIQGIQGVQGAQGAAGGSTNWRGEWTNYTQYSNNDAVSYQGSSYIALTDVEGIAPPNPSYWNILASKGASPVKGVDYFDGANGANGANGYTPVKGVDYFDGSKGDKGDKGDPGATGAAGGTVAFKGAWSSVVNYVALDVVTYNGSSYVAKIPSLNISPTVTASWQLMAQKGTDGTPGAQGQQGIQGIQGEDGPNLVNSSTTTTYTGLLKGNGSIVQQAAAGTDYLAPNGNGSALTGLTKTQVGLPLADNTSDVNKPVSTAQQSALDLKAPKDNPTFTTGITTPAVIPSSADGTWRMNVRNSVTRSYTPQEGDMDTDAAGKLWLYTNVSGTLQWVEKGATGPAGAAGPAGPAGQQGPAGGSVTVNAPFSGAQSIAVGNAYTTSAAATLTLSSHVAGSVTVSAGADTKIVPDSAGSTFSWRNPITGVLNTSTAGWSIIAPSGSYAVIDSDGTGVFQVKLTTKNLQTGANEYISPVPIASASTTVLAFGSVPVGTTATGTTVLSNVGTANLVTGSPYFSGTDATKFSISANGCLSATVAPGSSCTESVTFTPGSTAGGPYSAQLNLPHNASGSPIAVALSGTGAGVGSGTLQISNTTAATGYYDTYSTHYSGQSFLIGSPLMITRVKVYVGTISGVGGTVAVRIGSSADLTTYAATGTANVTAADSNSVVTINLDTPYTAAAGTWYMGLIGPASYANRVTIGRAGNTYADGSYYSGNTGWPMVSTSSLDLYFEVYGQ